MTVRWSPEAAADFAAIVEYIRKQNPSAAERVAQKIYEGVAAGRNAGREGSWACPTMAQANSKALAVSFILPTLAKNARMGHPLCL